MPRANLPCGDIDPLGITGTPVVDLPSRTLLFDAMTTPDNGATTPPTITTAWSVSQGGRGSPFVTSTDGAGNAIVWGIGSEGDQRLHGFEGDTGAVVFAGGGANELMVGTRRFNTCIAARCRIYIANDNQVYAFTVPVPPFVLTNPVRAFRRRIPIRLHQLLGSARMHKGEERHAE